MAEHYRLEELTPLTSQETFSFIFEQSKFLLIGYPAKTIDRIWELTAGHPYYIQLIYDETLAYALEEARLEIDLATLDEVLPFILEKSTANFIRLIANLSQPALDTLAACAVAFSQQQPITPASVSLILDQNQRPLTAKELADTFNELQKGAMLRRDEWGGFTFIIPLMADWLLQQYPLKTSDLVISPVSRSQPLQPKWLILGGSGVIIILLLLLFVGWPRLDSSSITTPATSAAVAMVSPSETPTPPSTATSTATTEPTSTATAPLIPTQPAAAASDPLPTVTPPPTSTPTETSTPTLTPPPTATPLPTLTPAPTATSSSTLPPPPTATPTRPAPPTPALALAAGEFILLNPVALDQPSYGLTEFEWQWTGAVSAGTGFEVRVWREGESQTGVHDAVSDNQNGNIESLGENKYRLRVDITSAAGVQGSRGEYWWTVALVQVSPSYADLGQQAPPALMRFEPKDGGSGGSGGDGGGGGGVGID